MSETRKAITRGVRHGAYLAASSDPTRLRVLAREAQNTNVTMVVQSRVVSNLSASTRTVRSSITGKTTK